VDESNAIPARPWDRRNAVGTIVDDELRAELRGQLSDVFCCDSEELRGQTLEECFRAAELNFSASIYWGCWSDNDLAETL